MHRAVRVLLYIDTTVQTAAAVHDTAEEWCHLSLHEVLLKGSVTASG